MGSEGLPARVAVEWVPGEDRPDDIDKWQRVVDSAYAGGYGRVRLVRQTERQLEGHVRHDHDAEADGGRRDPAHEQGHAGGGPRRPARPRLPHPLRPPRARALQNAASARSGTLSSASAGAGTGTATRVRATST